MPSYEPQLIEEFADRLYKQASDVIASSVVAGVLVGGLFGVLVGLGIGFAQVGLAGQKAAATDSSPTILTAAVIVGAIVALVGGIAGYYSGKEKSFELRLKAQQALCQLNIEKNTRGSLVPR